MKTTTGKPETRGGLRFPAGGRPPKPEKRITIQICLDPENAEFLQAMGRGKNNYINTLLNKERKA